MLAKEPKVSEVTAEEAAKIIEEEKKEASADTSQQTPHILEKPENPQKTPSPDPEAGKKSIDSLFGGDLFGKSPSLYTPPVPSGEPSMFDGISLAERIDMVEEIVEEIGSEDPDDVLATLGSPMSKSDEMWVRAYLKNLKMNKMSKKGKMPPPHPFRFGGDENPYLKSHFYGGNSPKMYR